MNIRKFLVWILPLMLIGSVNVYAQQSWQQYVAGLRQQALAEGIRPEIFDMAFRNIHEPNRKVLHYDRTQPERRITYLQYRNSRAGKDRIQLGRSEFRKNQNLLRSVGHSFAVNPCIIVAIWGLETNYGHFMGDFPVVSALATLGYDNRRSAYFRKQLLLALHILNEGHVTMARFKGEWAGASGHPQFLPSSWKAYAVDYNQDGKKDIWTSLPDAFASMGNYLNKNGWQNNQPWYIEVSIPSNIEQSLITVKAAKPLSEWIAMGVRPLHGQFPNENLNASLIYPDGGPAMLVFNNFKVIMTWNYSTYYAGTIGYLANQICRK